MTTDERELTPSQDSYVDELLRVAQRSARSQQVPEDQRLPEDVFIAMHAGAAAYFQLSKGREGLAEAARRLFQWAVDRCFEQTECTWFPDQPEDGNGR